jgi:hypothetical protein
MPGPVVYVAVAISAAAAIIVFKEVGLSCILLAVPFIDMAVSSSMIPIYVQSCPPGRRDAERDLTCIHPHHRRPHLEVMVKTGCLLSEALKARRNRLSDQ